MMQYGGDGGQGVDYPSITASETRSFPESPLKQPTPLLPAQSPTIRPLPPREITDQTLDDAYVAFIFHCNPAIPISTDSTELRKVLRTPPKSDGKSFSTFTLFELIRRLELKEIRTWTQLAIQLGVEPPSAEKNQSAQKVQQYAVRLKRWMRAMHVDAFFEYCLSKPHAYYMEIPAQHGPFPEEGRDGVLMEEDLALRALLPEWRPKRGRRKAEERERDGQTPVSTAKRPQLDTSINDFDEFDGHHSALFPQSATPWSAHPNATGIHDSWGPFSAITPGAIASAETNTLHSNTAHPSGQQFRWRINAREVTPSTPYPQSAIPLSHDRAARAPFDEPQSAITPSGSKFRVRRRHGPAVSSAWSSGGNVAGGKLRGRPPSNRSVQDGPYSTFPANPNTKDGPTMSLGTSTPASTPIAGKSESPRFGNHSPRQSPKNNLPHQPLQARPSRLQLQVPQHAGGPVRLATPPTLLVNGEYGHSSSVSSNRQERRSSADLFDQLEVGESMSEDMNWRPDDHLNEAIRVPPFDYQTIAKAFAASLRRGTLDAEGPLTTEDADRLAERVIGQIRLNHDTTRQTSPGRMLEHCITLLGLNQIMGLSAWPPSSEKHVTVKKVEYVEGWAQGPYNDSGPQPQNTGDHHDVKDLYEVRWNVIYGDLVGHFQFKETGPGDHSFTPRHVLVEGPAYPDSLPQDRRHSQGTNGSTDRDGGSVDWKRKCFELQKKLKEKEEDLQGLRRRVFEAVF